MPFMAWYKGDKGLTVSGISLSPPPLMQRLLFQGSRLLASGAVLA